ncbi:MAG: cation transporter [Kangiella sp.]|nr:cation transporter [Kangiella sp.]MBD3653133.1 cation transporter [Kangiella sp.]
MNRNDDECCGCSDDSPKESSNPIERETGHGIQSDARHLLTQFKVPKMDCPSEERMIRMVLEDIKPKVTVKCDIPNRSVSIYHQNNLELITRKMESLNYGAYVVNTETIDPKALTSIHEQNEELDIRQAGILKWLLMINGLMFIVEMTIGWIAQSAGLIADSLDMFADAMVYGLALYAVGHTVKKKLKVAHLSGWLQLLLALGALFEVFRRYWFGSDPTSDLMMLIGLLALIANVTCLWLIFGHREQGAHMKASWIFSANDVIANTGVILAGGLVAWTGSRYPDLVIGLIIGLVVLFGATRILKLKA